MTRNLSISTGDVANMSQLKRAPEAAPGLRIVRDYNDPRSANSFSVSVDDAATFEQLLKALVRRLFR